MIQERNNANPSLRTIEHDNIKRVYLRAVPLTQGCPNHCPGCQNPKLDERRYAVDIEEIKELVPRVPGQSNTLWRRAFVQPVAARKEIADWCRSELGWNVWSFSVLPMKIFEMGEEQVAFLKSLDAHTDGLSYPRRARPSLSNSVVHAISAYFIFTMAPAKFSRLNNHRKFKLL